MRALVVSLSLSLTAAACASTRNISPERAGPPSCLTPSPVEWVRTADAIDRPELDDWCDTIGPAIVQDRLFEPARIHQIVVLSWNVHVGAARLEEVLDTIRGRSSSDSTGLVLLLQEVYRAGDLVPEAIPDGASIPRAIKHQRRTDDIVAVAGRLRMNLAYVPSMRNGRGQEDRGNAILSTEPLGDLTAIELPLGKQRRVAVAATVLPRGNAMAAIRVASVHLDTNRDRIEQGAALADRMLAQRADALAIVIGGDLNALRGYKDRVFAAVADRIPAEECGTGPTHTIVRARLDFIFSTLAVNRSCETLRNSYGSDHRPLLLTIGP